MSPRLSYTPMYAIYKLPSALGVTPGCLGKTFSIEVAGHILQAHMPSFKWDEEWPSFTHPAMPAEVERYFRHYTDWSEREHLFWGAVNRVNSTKRQILRCQVASILLTFRLPSSDITYSEFLHGRGHPQAPMLDVLFAQIDDWFARLGTWLEVAVDQDLDAANPLEYVRQPGSGLSILSLDGGIVSLPATASSMTVMMSSYEDIKLPLLRRAARQANLSNAPDDARLLLRDARSAYRRRSFRRSAIDAGSALEVALADFNRTVTHVRTSPRPTLGWYVREAGIAGPAGLPATIDADVVRVRNAAIHQNVTPTREQAAKAIEETKKILDRIRPLPV